MSSLFTTIFARGKRTPQENGPTEENRTLDQGIMSTTLLPLSYCGLVGKAGFEPATFERLEHVWALHLPISPMLVTFRVTTPLLHVGATLRYLQHNQHQPS